jgi:23S rRNA (pseudouridine1915-N3)-methyltransferase
LRIRLLAVGRLRSKPAQALFDDYARRLAWPIETREVEERRKLPPDRLKDAEAAKLIANLPDADDGTARIIALDEAGDTLTSAAFAGQVKSWRDGNVKLLVFVIGGADGLGDAVLARAHVRLSLGRMTWPHQLVRGLLAEQLFRAQSILSGHPYHRE